MKILLVLSLMLFFAVPGAAQNNCLPPGSPSISGLKLDMSPEQTRDVLGGALKIKVKKNDQKTIFQNYIKKSPPPVLAGVRALYLRFYNRKLYQIEVFYAEKSAIITLKDFTNSISPELNVSAGVWRNRIGDSIIECGDYTIVADKVLNPRIELTDETARAAVEAAREEKNKK